LRNVPEERRSQGQFKGNLSVHTIKVYGGSGGITPFIANLGSVCGNRTHTMAVWPQNRSVYERW